MTTSAARTAHTQSARTQAAQAARTTRTAQPVRGDLAYEYRLVWEASLLVDPEDPVFFDHPLDHVPAMMLVEGALRLAERAVTVVGSGRRMYTGRAAFRFGRFCELAPDPVVRVWSADEGVGTWDVEFRQGETVLGGGEVEWRAVPGGTAGDAVRAADGPEAEPVPPALVHRAHPENVLIGGFEDGPERAGSGGHRVRMLSPGPGHYYRRQSPETRSLGELMEGIRQFGILLAHEAREVELGRHFVVKGVEVDMERPVGRSEPLVLRSTSLPRQRGRGTGRLGFTIEAGDRPVGAALVSGTVVSSEAYQRIRGAAR
ncbi:hypothetical protein NX801_03535 [Streptomyces sp. LP05-1]|uniref:A-factor biosynthesis hotdog domain-containing protein n=1 Tax=Streptomyces pyxinae TaxID=2970734 RepID=A0ABT2CBG1_9ACTN|nr:AfsA-related hotdog domain-containing protein [Streptomyces sp. LP05-1]MCS0634743.1 hypothetical protein [Streptomyces sp. LP05-1]